jgi:hypothetical protein
MNKKQIASLILLLISAGIYLGSQKYSQSAKIKEGEAKSAIDEAFNADSEKQVADIKTQALEKETEQIRRFLSAWEKPVDQIQTQTEVEDVLTSSFRAANLVVIQQKYESRDVAQNAYIKKKISAAITVQDDYSKTLNWLGEIERKLPLARVDLCHITGADEAKSVRADVRIEVPLVQLK